MIKLFIKSFASITFMAFRIFVLDASTSPAHGHGIPDVAKFCAEQIATAANSSW